MQGSPSKMSPSKGSEMVYMENIKIKQSTGLAMGSGTQRFSDTLQSNPNVHYDSHSLQRGVSGQSLGERPKVIQENEVLININLKQQAQ